MEIRSVDAQSFQLRLESLPRHTEYCGPHPSHPTLDAMRRAGTLIIVFFACRDVSGQRCAWLDGSFDGKRITDGNIAAPPTEQDTATGNPQQLLRL
jgi:hypothetical protein